MVRLCWNLVKIQTKWQVYVVVLLFHSTMCLLINRTLAPWICKLYQVKELWLADISSAVSPSTESSTVLMARPCSSITLYVPSSAGFSFFTVSCSLRPSFCTRRLSSSSSRVHRTDQSELFLRGGQTTSRMVCSFTWREFSGFLSSSLWPGHTAQQTDLHSTSAVVLQLKLSNKESQRPLQTAHKMSQQGSSSGENERAPKTQPTCQQPL